MSYTVYTLIHLIGLALICFALGGFNMGGATEDSTRKRLAMAHGGGLFLVLLGGFGMIAKNNAISAMHPWVLYKILVWITLGGAIVIFKRKPNFTGIATIILGVLMMSAAYLGLFH